MNNIFWENIIFLLEKLVKVLFLEKLSEQIYYFLFRSFYFTKTIGRTTYSLENSSDKSLLFFFGCLLKALNDANSLEAFSDVSFSLVFKQQCVPKKKKKKPHNYMTLELEGNIENSPEVMLPQPPISSEKLSVTCARLIVLFDTPAKNLLPLRYQCISWFNPLQICYTMLSKLR